MVFQGSRVSSKSISGGCEVHVKQPSCSLNSLAWIDVSHGTVYWQSATLKQPSQSHISVKTTVHQRLNPNQSGPIIQITIPINTNNACNSLCFLFVTTRYNSSKTQNNFFAKTLIIVYITQVSQQNEE